MNWKQRLFKPKWQNKNVDIRLESVSSDNTPELINSLVEIASNDQDSGVRTAAVRRLHQLENILKLYASEQNPDVRKVLEDRIRQLAAATNETRPALALRMQVIEMTSKRELIEHLAGHAPETELRRAAIAKVTRQGVLGDCAIEDKDAELRSFAASRITQQTTLKRVIDALRKRDKALYSQLQLRLHNELLNQGDTGAIHDEAVTICAALEKLALENASIESAEIGELQSRWKTLGAKTGKDLELRYQRVCQRLEGPKEQAPVVEPKPPIVTEAIEVPVKEEPPAKIEAPQANLALAQIATDICVYETEYGDRPSHATVKKMRAQLERAWKHSNAAHPDDQTCWDTANTALSEMEQKLELKHQQFEKVLEQAQKLIAQMEEELENGELHNALETRAKLQVSSKEHGRNREWKPVNAKMTGMQARLRELRDWHHWSNNKIRKRLIAEMEVLPAADLHPDALLDRIKSLQTEWKTLEQSEQIPGDKKFMAEPWMWRKFSDAGHTAFDTAKPYLDKRSEIQSRLAETMDDFCTNLRQLAEAEPRDWAALGKGMTEGRKKLRELNNLPHKQRQKLARKLKSALDKGNAATQARYEGIEREKMKLIRAASQLIHMPERDEAIEKAKSLQSNWKAAGSLWRSKEQELWTLFREHLDPLFSELKEQQASIKAADDERLSAQKDLNAELAGILESKEDLSGLHGKVLGLQAGWKDIEHPDRRLLQNFETMIDEYQQKLAKLELQLEAGNRERWWQKADLLHDLSVNGRTLKGTISKKAEAAFNKAWPEHSSNDEIERSLDQAKLDVLSGDISTLNESEIEEATSRARLLCIGLEFIAGITSPDDEREQRMKYQVDRLADSMSGAGSRQSVSEEAREGEKTWLSLYALPEHEFKLFGVRVKAALNAIDGPN